jgi:outer membrane lipoprotein-sorting protein
MNILRRISLGRLLLGCALVAVLGGSLAAIALAIGGGPTPPRKPLAQAIHDALGGGAIEGFSAEVELTNHLLDGAQFASGGGGGGGGEGLTSSPLLNGGSGRLWVSADGRMRLELQAEKGDTQVLYDGSELRAYDASTNTLYRLKLPAHEASTQSAHQPPSVSEIEEGIARLERHHVVSGATPTDVGGQPAYTVRVSPKEAGSLLAGVELSFDADRGVPLRAAVYSTESSAPALELAASSVSYGPVPDSVFDVQAPGNAKVEEFSLPKRGEHEQTGSGGEKPKVTIHGHGPSAVAVIEAKSHGAGEEGTPTGLEQVKVGSTTASQLKTELGTLLTFERAGIRYFLLGSVTPATIDAVASGL